MFLDENAEERYAIGSLSHSEYAHSLAMMKDDRFSATDLMKDEVLAVSVRDEPDGQSETSEVTPPTGLQPSATGERERERERERATVGLAG